MKPFWVTFYSYKGGVGRSLALANMAALLVKRGRRVLLVDFDLEAPGLDSFGELGAAAGKPGVVEYVSEFLERSIAPDIERFVHRCELPGPLRGELCVMPAGRRDAAYNQQLSRLDWAALYDSGLGAPFFANWKAAIDQHFAPDYVFVDSRTGLTEIGGVCTTQFPDLVVMLFGLNDQNVNGVATVAQSIREADPERVPQIHYVATPVPNLSADQRGAATDRFGKDRRNQLTERLEAAEERLGVKLSSTIRYYPPASLVEKLFVLERGFSRQAISGDYERLCGKIVEFNRTGLDFLMEQADTAIAAGDAERLDRLRTVLQRDYADRAEAIHVRARFAVARNEIGRAVELAEQALALDPSYEEPYRFLVDYYLREWRPERVAELSELVYARVDRLSAERRYRLQQERGSIFMALGQGHYVDARICYSECMDYLKEHTEDPAVMLRTAFNLAEATRRAYGRLEVEIWKQVAAFFESAGASSDAPLPVQANQFQAMHIAFACSGAIPAAREALRKARRAAEMVGEIEDIFSVKDYRMVPVAEFLAISDTMSAALDRGELWDGMKLAI